MMTVHRPLRFVTLVGSLRRDSLHATVARALPALAPEGVEVAQLGSVGELPHYNADLQAEGFPPAVTAMADAIRAADGVVVVTPEYNYSIPGALKNALDWLSRVTPQPFAGKPVAIQTGSPGMIGGARAQYHLRQTFVFLDAHVLNKPEIMIGTMASKVAVAEGRISDEDTESLVAQQLTALAAAARLASDRRL